MLVVREKPDCLPHISHLTRAFPPTLANETWQKSPGGSGWHSNGTVLLGDGALIPPEYISWKNPTSLHAFHLPGQLDRDCTLTCNCQVCDRPINPSLISEGTEDGKGPVGIWIYGKRHVSQFP